MFLSAPPSAFPLFPHPHPHRHQSSGSRLLQSLNEESAAEFCRMSIDGDLIFSCCSHPPALGPPLRSHWKA